jgi:L-arabonate dehydrase
LFATTNATAGSPPSTSSSSSPTGTKTPLRSTEWFGKLDKDGFIHRSWMRNQGLPDHVFDGRPVIGIANTFSELTPCNAHFRELAEYVKRGVWEMGAVPVEFPVLSTGETLMRPTAMLYRNLMSMDCEEMIRANPIDGVVLLAGCDKTTPGLLMGAASTGVPTILVSGGPMLNGKYKGRDIGSGTDVWKLSEEVRAGRMSSQDFFDAESCMSRSRGHCMTMGTASTMACMAEALGMTLPGNATIPAADSRRNALAHMSGRRAVEMVREDLGIAKVLTRQAFENAILALSAIGGSTNAVIHLLALARRVGVPLHLRDFDEIGSHIPLLVNLAPSGKYLMEDFYYAGGLPAVLRELKDGGKLRAPALTVNGRTIGDNVKDAPNYNRDVVAPLASPVKADAGIVVLTGNLAPRGAVLKPSAASPHLFRHRGKAFVFESAEIMKAQIDDPDLPVDKDTVLVLKGTGPVGYPGMPERGNLPLPRKVLEAGITDMVRVSDARMSGTAYGTVVLHVAPESAVGGPLALVQTGDEIELDVAGRRLHLHVSDEELARRRAAWVAPSPVADRGYVQMYVKNVNQADEGADFGFLQGASGAPIPRESH